MSLFKRKAETNQRVQVAIQVCRAAAVGDLEQRILHIDDAGDPLAVLWHSINQLLDLTDAFVRESTASLDHVRHEKYFRRILKRGLKGTFLHGADLINAAVKEIGKRAEQLAEMRDREKQTATAIEDTTNTIRMELTTVTGALTEMDAVGKSNSANATEAVENARQSHQIVSELSDVIQSFSRSVESIGEVSQAISEIAQQTNMLALNATIEASRAGAAGQGFAVVANEIKELARRTAQATEDVSKKVRDLQGETKRTGEAIRTADESIQDNEKHVILIAQSVTEQSTAVSQISDAANKIFLDMGKLGDEVSRLRSPTG